MPLRVCFHVGIEPLGGTGKVPVGLAPNLISVKKGLRADIGSLGLLTALFEELQAQVVVTLVLVDHLPHGGGHFQTETLVLEVPGDQPSENTLHSFLCLKLIFQVLVLLRFGEMAVELNDPHTVGSEQGLVADGGKIVAGEPKGELRQKGRGSFIEVSSLDFFAARELLDRFFVQLAILVTLCHCDKPFAFQGSQHGVRCFGVLRAFCLADDRHGRHRSIITEKVMIIGWEAVEDEYDNDNCFWLEVSGNSMAPKIDNGDRVLIQRDAEIESGCIAVVVVDGTEGFLKQVEFGENSTSLHSFNPYYPDMEFVDADQKRLHFVGRVREMKRRF